MRIILAAILSLWAGSAQAVDWYLGPVPAASLGTMGVSSGAFRQMLGLSSSAVQNRVAGNCQGQVMVAIAEDGTPTCEADDTGAGGLIVDSPLVGDGSSGNHLRLPSIPASLMDGSTYTTAINARQASDADLDDLTDGSLTGSKVGSGVPAANIASGLLGSQVIASSAGAITVPATCGDSTTSCRLTFGADGRIVNVSSQSIAGGSEGPTYAASSKTITLDLLVKSSNNASGFFIYGATVTTIFGSTRTKTVTDQVVYGSATVPVDFGANINGLAFSLARNSTYYFEFDILHESTATATGIWFGLTWPAGSTCTVTARQMVSLSAETVQMARVPGFLSAAGASVDAINSTLPARMYGTISTGVTAGILQPRVKMELQNGRGTIKAGSTGKLEER